MADEQANRLMAPAPPVPLARLEVDFVAFYRRELAPMVALATAIAGPARAEDIAQEAMLRAHRHWSEVGAYDKPGAWLRRVTTNLAISARRRGLRERLALARRTISLEASFDGSVVAPPFFAPMPIALIYRAG